MKNDAISAFSAFWVWENADNAEDASECMTINLTLAIPPKVQKCKKCNRVLSKNEMKGVNQGGKRKKTNRIKNNKRKQNIHKSVSFICRNYPIKYIFSTH
jgi:hypothetical protein